MGLKKSSLLSDEDKAEGAEELFCTHAETAEILGNHLDGARREIDSLNQEMADLEFELDTIIESLENIISAGKAAHQQGTMTNSEILTQMVKDLRTLITAHKK